MISNDKNENILDNLIFYHKRLEEYFGDLGRVETVFGNSSGLLALKKFQKELITHFQLEEQRVFPAINNVEKTERVFELTEEYSREHRLLLAELSNAIEGFGCFKTGYTDDEKRAVCQVIDSVIQKIIKHVKSENTHIMEKIENSALVRAFLDNNSGPTEKNLSFGV